MTELEKELRAAEEKVISINKAIEQEYLKGLPTPEVGDFVIVKTDFDKMITAEAWFVEKYDYYSGRYKFVKQGTDTTIHTLTWYNFVWQEKRHNLVDVGIGIIRATNFDKEIGND